MSRPRKARIPIALPFKGEGKVGMVFGSAANTIPIPAFPLKGKD